MNVAFVGNHYKTYIYHPIAAELEKKSHRVFWIVPSHTLRQWLEERGVARHRILDVSDHGDEWSSNPGPLTAEERHILGAFERHSKVSFNNMVLMDRNLRDNNPNHSLRYLLTCCRLIAEFMKNDQIDTVFCEQTLGLELATGVVAASLGKKCLRPHIIRIPDERLAFFECPFEDTIVERPACPAKEIESAIEADAFYADFVARKPKPSFFYRNNVMPRPRLDWLPKTYKHIRLSLQDRHDESRYKLSWLLFNRPKEAINALAIKNSKVFTRVDELPDLPYVLFALHKQPEYSIDVLGSYYSDQLETIRMLSMSLPSSHMLMVKEHSNAIGDRSCAFYTEARKLPNVLLVDPFCNSHDLIRNADLVLAVSGTIAYEAALFGKRAATLAKMFFGPLLLANGIDIRSDGHETIRGLLDTPVADPKEKAVPYFSWLFRNSYSCIYGDPVTTPHVGDDDNISRIASAFDEMAHGGGN